MQPEDEGFTDAYFYHPQKARKFISEFDLDELVMAGVEGLVAASEEETIFFPRKHIMSG